jgi:hypothetical protein
MKKTGIITSAVLGLGLFLGACNVTSSPTVVQSTLKQIAGIAVAVECTPTATNDATSILNVLGANNVDVSKVIAILEANQAVAAALCPGIESIVAAVGTLPSGTPTVVAVPASAKAGAGSAWPYPVIWKTPAPK